MKRPIRRRAKTERRWLRAGLCVSCGKPRARVTLRGRKSARFCRKHLATNREYQKRYRKSRARHPD